MNANDPRHGTSAGYVAGCRDVCCRTAIADWTRHARTRRYLQGDLMVPSLGTRRRIQALMALGWSTRVIDERIGKRRTYTAAILCADPEAPIRRVTADMYGNLYARLSMTLPPTETRYEKQVATRCRNYARSQGWPVPLAWDDIDDPDEQPTDWQYRSTDRAEAIRDLADMGANATEVARRLHMSREAVEVMCRRSGMSDVYRRLAAREAVGTNQHMRESA